jgi:predicted transcriptional regulator of viral defense system
MGTAEERQLRRERIRSEICTTAEAVEILGFTRMYINQLINKGRMEPVQRGCFLKADLEAFKNGEAFLPSEKQGNNGADQNH